MSSKHTSLIGTFGGSLGRRSLRVLGLVCGVVLALVLFAVLANPAKAETFTVTNTTDTSDGTCDADCSLREAINAANATTQADTVTFASGVSGEILLSNGELRVESAGGPLRIEGPGADQLAVDGAKDEADSSRVFLVTTGAEAEIAGLTVRDGSASSGGGIFSGGKLTLTNTTVSSNDAIGTSSNDGGGIYNNGNGTLTVNNSTISGNTASRGGGIFNVGTLTVNSSTISGNSAFDGGGIFSFTRGISSTTPNPADRTTLRNSTISGNEASGRGGGVYNLNGLTVIENSTITKNIAPQDRGAGVASLGQSDTRTDVRASIISENTSTDVDSGTFNSFNSLGSNIVGDGNATGAFNESGDQTGVTDPGLGPLQDNGGPTQTHEVLTGSPALDTVVGNCDPAEDQRGVARPQDGDNDGIAVCDVGSVEKGLVALNPGSKDYGNQKVATQSAQQTFTVENTGDTTTNFTVSSVSIAGADPGQFEDQNDQCTGSTLAPGESCTVEVVFSPNSTGAKSAVLRVESDASSSSNTAQLSGTGTAPGVSLTPTTQDYGNQKEGTTSAPQTFTVENTGNASLDVGVVDLQGSDPGQFTEQSDNCQNSTVAPGDNCAIEVVFSPNSTGAKSAVLQVQSDASSTPDTAQLEGDGTAPDVSLTPTAHDYGNQQEGTISSPQTFTVENTGDAELDVGTVDIQGAEPGQFTEQTDNCEGNTVAPGDTCTVEVAFSPDSAGAKSAVLRVQSDASSSSDAPTSSEASTGFDEVQLSGSGTAIPVPPPVIDIPIVDTPPIRPPSIKPPAPNIKPPKNKACTIKGNNKDDVLHGTPKRDVICGFGGNDRIRGLGGNDIIKGGRGHDIIYGNKGNDKLFGQKGNDALFGGKGRDVLLGGKGKNALVGGKGKDVERGGVAPADTKKQTKKLTKKVIKDIFKQVGVR